MSHVPQTLELAEKLLTSREDIATLRPFLGRLTNAMVALLGPELLPGSRNYIICKSLMRQMKPHPSLMCSAEGISGALELVLYAQQLILFAPQAVPAKKHVAILMESLSLPHPSLRYTAAVTLKPLIERDPLAICQEAIEAPLFEALDAESEAHISRALMVALEALESAQCPTRPSIWLNVCAAVVLVHARETPQRQVLHTEESLMAEEVEEESEPVISPKENGRTPRLRTRLFACQCLLKIFEAVGRDPLHFDPIKAKQAPNKQEYLVGQLQAYPFNLPMDCSAGDREIGIQSVDWSSGGLAARRDQATQYTHCSFWRS